MKHRLERVNELLKRELSEVVGRELRFTDAIVTIQAVDVTPDLKHAHVFVSVLGDDASRRKALNKLRDHRGELQRTVSKRVILKYTPYIHFKLDESIERGTRIMQILDEIGHPEEKTDQPDED
jgi:ribosome-binding factor A